MRGVAQLCRCSEKTPVKHDRKNKSNFIGPLIGVNENRGLTPARLQAAGPYPHPVLKVMGYPTQYYRVAPPLEIASAILYGTGEVISEVSGCLHCLLYLLGVRTVEAAAYCLMPVTLWQRHSARSTSQFSGLFYNWSFLVVDKASLTPPGSQFRAPSRLLLKITDYLSLLPTFPGSDIRTPGVSRPGFA